MNQEMSLAPSSAGMPQNADSSTEIVSLFTAGIADLDASSLRYMTLPVLADVLGLELCDPRLIRCVSTLTETGMLDCRAQYVDIEDQIHDFDAAAYAAALKAGFFVEPASGQKIEDTDMLAPYWSARVPLAA